MMMFLSTLTSYHCNHSKLLHMPIAVNQRVPCPTTANYHNVLIYRERQHNGVSMAASASAGYSKNAVRMAGSFWKFRIPPWNAAWSCGSFWKLTLTTSAGRLKQARFYVGIFCHSCSALGAAAFQEGGTPASKTHCQNRHHHHIPRRRFLALQRARIQPQIE